MAGTLRDALAVFVADLERLRQDAGNPSLQRLVELSADGPRPLARSTISDKFKGKSLPDWEFVVAFVGACAAHAQAIGAALDPDQTDLARWDAEHQHMLTAIDGGRARPPSPPFNSAGPPAQADAGQVVPRQLPAAVAGFVGRAAEMARLERAVEAGAAIVTLNGTAGVGKTAFALHWAHRLADRYPDGQLYVDLRAFHPTAAPMAAAEALRGFLDAFHVRPPRIPATLDGQAALFRSLLTGKRVLLVLDNVGDVERVRPLLPGGPGCLVIVTSRDRLTSLVAVAGAHPLTVELLTPGESRDVLMHRLGESRVNRELAAADEIGALCAGLPLALCVVAARAAAHPTFALADLARELRRASGGLDAGHSDVNVRIAFSWSYRRLSAGAAAMFRMLGLCPAREVTTAAAASLAGLDLPVARQALAELARVHLAEEAAPGRYSHHDLLRAYATELSDTVDADADRRAAVGRLLDHYVHTARAGALLLTPHRSANSFPPPGPGVTVAALTDQADVLSWFAAEQPALVGAVLLAAETGSDAHAAEIAWCAFDIINRRGYWQEWVDAQMAALRACQRCGDRPGEAYAHYALGLTYVHLGRDGPAVAHLERALTQYEALADHAGQAHTHMNLGGWHQMHGRYQDALVHVEQAQKLYEIAGFLMGLARSMNSTGWCHAQLGNYPEAVTQCRRALSLLQDLGDKQGEASTWDSLGLAYSHLGRHLQASECFETGLALSRELGDRSHEAEVLTHIGDNRRADGDETGALAHWREALTILDELGHPSAATVRARLESPAGALT